MSEERVANQSLQAAVLPVEAYNEIVAHAREGKPEEICGILRGKGLVAYAAVRGENIATERIENYEVDPRTLLRQFDFEEAGEEMMGIYHSHPVSVAYPSATDAWNAHYPDALYFICSLEDDDEPVIRTFRMTPHWLELDYATLRTALNCYETRPGLWAYYQPDDRPVPDELASLRGEVPTPFYVVLSRPVNESDQDSEAQSEVDGRVVSIVEHPVTVQGG